MEVVQEGKVVGHLQVGLLVGTLEHLEKVGDRGGEEVWGGLRENNLLRGGDPAPPLVVEEGSNCDWL